MFRNKSGFVLVKKCVRTAAMLQTAEAISTAVSIFKDEANRHRKYLKAIGAGTYFSESFNALMKTYFEPLNIPEYKYGSEIFDKTGISDKIYRDMRNGDVGYCPTHRMITALCAGFDFDVKVADYLLKKGGKSFSVSDEHIAFRTILTAFRGNDIYAKNDYLEAMGYGRLTEA